MLYDHFNATFWARIERTGLEKVQEMAEKIKQFSKDLEDECIDGYREVESWNGKMIKGMKFIQDSKLGAPTFINVINVETLSRGKCHQHKVTKSTFYQYLCSQESQRTSADSAVRFLSGITVRGLSVKIKFKFEIRTFKNPPDWKFQTSDSEQQKWIPTKNQR